MIFDTEMYENEDYSDWDKSIITNSTRLLMKQISSYKLLTIKEEQELGEKSRQGDIEARNKLMEGNFRLVISIVKQYKCASLTFLDLFQEGCIGLAKAATLFDPSKGYRFSTYATHWIKQAISRAITDQNRIIRIPSNVMDLVSKIKKATNELTQELGHTPNNTQIAHRLQIPVQKVKEIKEAMNETLSLDLSVGDDDETTIGDLIQDKRFESPEHVFDKEDLKNQIYKVLNTLDEDEANIIKLRFGLEDGKPKTLSEIGKIYNYSREWIRVKEEKAMRKLRSPLRKNMLIDYLN